MTGPLQPTTYQLRRQTPGSFLLVPCRQEGRSLRCQGHLEADLARILAACPAVAHVTEQPLRIRYAWRNANSTLELHLLECLEEGPLLRQQGWRLTWIAPDFLVELSTGQKWLIEVKPASRLADALVQRKLAVGRWYAARQDWHYLVLTDSLLREGPLLANVRLLQRYQHFPIEPQIRQAVLERIPGHGITVGTLGSLLPAVPGPRLAAHLWHLLGWHQLGADLVQHPWNPDLVLFPHGACVWDPFPWWSASSGSSRAGSSAWCAASVQTAAWPSTSSSTSNASSRTRNSCATIAPAISCLPPPQPRPAGR